VFLPNYSSGNVKTNSIRPVLAGLAFFEAVWHFFTSGLAFFVHLDLATLLVQVISIPKEFSFKEALQHQTREDIWEVLGKQF